VTRPNLFSFATSELSQDALLCWLSALALHDDVDLQQLGRTFIAWLWGRAKGTSIAPEQVRLLKNPERQVNHIDVMFEAEIAGVPTLFVIEDKTETSHHSGQLKRYLEAVKHGQVVPIYFKTGYHFGADIAAADAKYTVIGLAEWVRFLKAQTVRNDIFEDYRAYVGEMLEKRQAALAALMTPTGFIEAFEQDFVQFEFMQLLASACPEFVGRHLVYGGKSMGGDAWTQYLFAQFEGVLPAGIKESLFYRLDRRRDGWYLAVRQYAKVEGADEARGAKLKRLSVYRELFKRAAAKSAATESLGRASTDNRGKNESEIAVMFFSESGNTPSRVLEVLPAVHRAFVEQIADGLPI